MKQNIRGYIFSRPFMSERVPQHVQNLVIRDYCERNDLNYLLSATEYEMDGCHLILNQVLNELSDIDGIAAYSLYQMPEDPMERQRIFSEIAGQNKSIHFAVEGLKICKEADINRIETLWNIKKVLPLCELNFNKLIQKNSGQLRSFVTPLHLATKRDYLARMSDDKVHCMTIAKQYNVDYWDGERRYGYGGYRYIPGRWKPVAEALIKTYDLKPGAKVLDVGCGKGFLLYEMLLLEPSLQIKGIDISEYGINCAPTEVRPNLFIHRAQDPLPFKDGEFDLVISLGTLHNLRLFDVKSALQEIERVSKNAYVMLESYQNEQELFNLQCWALTCESFFDSEEWIHLYNNFGYTGDYEFIYFET